jgi:hypothetical protein
MELSLQPLSPTCFVSGQPFIEGHRVASFLVRNAADEILRCDVLESELEKFTPEGFVACRWVHVFKTRKAQDNSERELKLTAENLFITLADPANELTADNSRLVQFLALMLERKRVLRPKGPTPDRVRQMYEHAKTKQIYEVPAGDLNPEFFVAIQQQLSVLVGAPKPKTEPASPGS